MSDRCAIARELVMALEAIATMDQARSAAAKIFRRPMSRAAMAGILQRHIDCCGVSAAVSSHFGKRTAASASRAFVAAASPKASSERGLSLLVPDVHIPYEDPSAWSLLLAVARSAEWKNLVVLGDFADCYSVSQHEKSPSRTSRIADELAVVSERLRELEAASGSARRIYCEGNHEARLSKYIARQAGALHGLRGLSYQEIVELPSNGWQWVPYYQSIRIGDLDVTHDVGRVGINSVRQSRLAHGASIAIGHVHRMGLEVERTQSGHTYLGAAFGWLGSASAIDYMHRGKASTQWVHGCGVAYVDDLGHTHIQPVPFVANRAVVAGRLIVG